MPPVRLEDTILSDNDIGRLEGMESRQGLIDVSGMFAGGMLGRMFGRGSGAGNGLVYGGKAGNAPRTLSQEQIGKISVPQRESTMRMIAEGKISGSVAKQLDTMEMLFRKGYRPAPQKLSDRLISGGMQAATDKRLLGASVVLNGADNLLDK